MTVTEAAFLFSAERLFEESEQVYFWTFTFKRPMPDWYYANVWHQLIRDLSNLYGGTLRGLKVVELHKDHGIHYHCLLNKRIWVGEVRRLCRKYGVGRIHVKKANQGAIGYLSKYLSKQFVAEHKLHARVSRWGTVGGFKACRVKDVVMDTPFHRLIKRAQELTALKKLPWNLTQALYRQGTMTDEQLKAAVFRYCGHRTTSMIFSAQPHRYTPEATRRCLAAMKR